MWQWKEASRNTFMHIKKKKKTRHVRENPLKIENFSKREKSCGWKKKKKYQTDLKTLDKLRERKTLSFSGFPPPKTYHKLSSFSINKIFLLKLASYTDLKTGQTATTLITRVSRDKERQQIVRGGVEWTSQNWISNRIMKKRLLMRNSQSKFPNWKYFPILKGEEGGH